jgi:hypothetical protein
MLLPDVIPLPCQHILQSALLLCCCYVVAGGRNRKFLRDPGPLDYKDNPEHGLRLILTFRPNTSFLVPLDR